MSPEIRCEFRHFDHNDDDDVRETDTRIWCIISKSIAVITRDRYNIKWRLRML